jgi:hypothetical protein
MCELGFANGVDVESDFKEILMIKNIPAVEDEGRFSHGLIYLVIIDRVDEQITFAISAEPLPKNPWHGLSSLQHLAE